MSLYSGSLKTHIVDNISFSQSRTVFTFDKDTMFYSNLRLVDLGVKGTATRYNPLAGCFGAIRHIRLMDGAKEIDSMRFANRYLAWNNLLASNAHNRDFEGRMTKNEIGYSINEDQQLVPGACPNAAAKTENQTIDAAGLTASLGSLDVRKCLKLLNKLTVLDTVMFENLRLEIEWETDARNTIVSQAAGDSAKLQCALICDEITDPKLQEANRRQMGAVVWEAIEHDQFQVPDNITVANALADAAVATQSVNNKVNGFDGKLVNRCVMMKCYTDKTKNIDTNNVVAFGDLGSRAQLREKINVSKNGGRLFTGDGLSKAGTAALLADTWGAINIAPFQDKTSVGKDNKNDASVHKEGCEPPQATDQALTVGTLSYAGWTIADRINDLQISYERSNVKDSIAVQKYNEALDIHLFCEVSKSFIPLKGGQYVVKYN